MLIGKRCTVCHADVDDGDRVTCDSCGSDLHEQCADYEERFTCPECADDLEIGSLEL